MKTNIRKLGKSFHYASKGIHHTYSTQQNIWIHSGIGLTVMVVGVLLGLSTLELAITFLTIILVIILEIINTVAETIIDLASPEFTELGRIAKDVAAGSVLIAAIGSVVIGILIFGPYILRLLHI